MFNLILKDLMIQKKTMLLGSFYIIAMILAFQSMGQNNENTMFASGVVALTYILVMGACAYDEKCKSDVMLNSLPIKRADIVLSRYLSVLAFAGVGTVEYIAISSIINLSGLPIKAYPITLQGFIGVLFAVIFISSIYFPVYFKVGYIRSKMINLIVFFAVFFLIGSISYIIKESMNQPAIHAIVDFFSKRSDLQIILLCMSVLFLMMAGSYTLALKFYKNREF